MIEQNLWVLKFQNFSKLPGVVLVCCSAYLVNCGYLAIRDCANCQNGSLRSSVPAVKKIIRISGDKTILKLGMHDVRKRLIKTTQGPRQEFSTHGFHCSFGSPEAEPHHFWSYYILRVYHSTNCLSKLLIFSCVLS